MPEAPRGVSKTDGSQSLDLQRDALRTAGVDEVNLYHDYASGLRDDRPGLDSCLRALRNDDVLVVWKLDRLGRNLAHLVNTVQDLSAREVGLRVLAGQGAQIDTTTAAGRLVFGIFAALAEFAPARGRTRTSRVSPRVLHQPHRLVDERRALLDPIQDTLELHPSCAEPPSRPSAPRSGGGAERRAWTPASTRARCGSDEGLPQPSILPTDSAEDP